MNQSLKGDDTSGRWGEMFGESPAPGSPPASDGSAILRKTGEGVEIVSRYELVKEGAELVLADETGRFKGSWCEGKLGFASLVLPQTNTKGRVSSKWKIPFYDIKGELMTGAAAESIKARLAGSVYLSGRSSEPYIDYHLDRYACPAVIAFLEVASADLEWSADGFACFDAGNRFDSESSHSVRLGDALMGEAEMFTWHRAPIRMSWDLRCEGDLVSAEIPLAEGASFQRGGFKIEFLGVEEGEFNLRALESKAKRGEPMAYLRSDSENPIRTCFLAGNFPGGSITRVEARGSDGSWMESTFAAEGDGVILVESPGEITALRLSWKPRLMRIVVDVTGIGGSLPENDGVTTYNEIRFPLFGAFFDNSGVSWRLWQLLGRYPRINADRFDAARSPGARAVQGRLYRAEELYQSWQRMNPDLIFRFDTDLNAIVIDDR